MDSGKLVAKCPGCSFLVLCNELEEPIASLWHMPFTFWASAGDELHQVLAQRSHRICACLWTFIYLKSHPEREAASWIAFVRSVLA